MTKSKEQVICLLLAQKELANAKKLDLPDEAFISVLIAQEKIINAIKICEQEN